MAETLVSGRQFVIAASAARTATFTSNDYVFRTAANGLHIIIKVTSITSTPILTPTIDARTALGNYYNVLTGANITATGTTVLKLGRGVGQVANGSAADMVPNVLRVVLTAADSDSATYSVEAEVF